MKARSSVLLLVSALLLTTASVGRGRSVRSVPTTSDDTAAATAGANAVNTTQADTGDVAASATAIVVERTAIICEQTSCSTTPNLLDCSFLGRMQIVSARWGRTNGGECRVTRQYDTWFYCTCLLGTSQAPSAYASWTTASGAGCCSSYCKSNFQAAPNTGVYRPTCSGSDVTAKIQGLCNNKSSCFIPATTTFLNDSCVGIYKYLEIKYRCILL
jgi:hypothetical protein